MGSLALGNVRRTPTVHVIEMGENLCALMIGVLFSLICGRIIGMADKVDFVYFIKVFKTLVLIYSVCHISVC